MSPGAASKPTRRQHPKNAPNGSGRMSPPPQPPKDEDEVLMMRDKAERDEDGAVSRVGALASGVTKPKRRMSSPPPVPIPLLVNNRAQFNIGSEDGSGGPQSTYSAMSSQMSGASHTYDPPAAADLKILLQPEVKEGGPKLWGIELKWISLITLALQNAFLTIIMHYSRISTAPNKTYSAAAAVLLNELLKGIVSIVIALKRIDVTMAESSSWHEKDPKFLSRPNPSRLPSYLHSSRIQNLTSQVFSPDCYKLAVPAILYVIQNNLQYVAASNLDVATFQVTYQMKILTTAFFSVLLLRKRLSRTKWLALVMLAVGVGIVQIQSTSAPSHPAPSHAGSHHDHKDLGARAPQDETILIATRVMHPLRGFIAVILACMTSGLAGVYFEFILKSSSGSSPPPDLWVRNTQLSLFSLVPALVPILFGGSNDPTLSWLGGVINKFQNFNGWAIGTILTQTFGGLVTAIVIRYSDNIMKGFATSLSIVISFMASVALFSYPITLAFVIGSSIVLCATYIYNSPNTQSPSSRAAVAVAPGSPITTSAPILGEPEKPSRASSVINLLGLGSNAPSRRPSSTDLRNSNLGFSAPSMSNLSHSMSSPGSAYPSSTNIYDPSNRSSPAPEYRSSAERSSGGRDKPISAVDTAR